MRGWTIEVKRGQTDIDFGDWAKGRELCPQIVLGGAEGEVAYILLEGRGRVVGDQEQGKRRLAEALRSCAEHCTVLTPNTDKKD